MTTEEPRKFKLHKDKFTKARGGTSKFLIIRCTNCGNAVLLYQKDGPGQLFRLYLDKIHAPESFSSLKHTATSKSTLGGLHCTKCKELLAVPMVYIPENRLALRIIRGSVKAEKSEGIYPPTKNVTDENIYTEEGNGR